MLLGVIGLDQLTKYFALQKDLPNWEVFSQLVCNQNLSLGLNLEAELFVLSWILAIIFLLFLIAKTNSVFLILALGGAFSNLIDRFTQGCVVDFIATLNFPLFNLADFFISFGFLAFIFLFKTK